MFSLIQKKPPSDFSLESPSQENASIILEKWGNLREVAPEERTHLVSQIHTYVLGILTNQDKYDFTSGEMQALRSLGKAKEKEREYLQKLVAALVPQGENYGERVAQLILFFRSSRRYWWPIMKKELLVVPEGERDKLVTCCYEALMPYTFANPCGLIKALNFISPESRDAACAQLIEDALNVCFFSEKNVHVTILNAVFTQLPSVKEASHGYIEKRLMETRNAAEAKYLVEYLTVHGDFFYLNSNSSLFLLVAEIRSAIEDCLDIKNPYTIFQKLTDLARRKTSFRLPLSKVMGELVLFNLDAIRENSVFTIDRQDLPEVAPDSLTQLVASLDNRLAALPDDEREKTLSFILGISSVDLEILKTASLKSSLFEKLLTISPGPVPILSAQFTCIMKYIVDQPDTLEKDSPLTPREYALVQLIGTTLQGCGDGKEGGITPVYNLLPRNYKLAGLQEIKGEPEIVKVQQFFAVEVQRLLSNQFSGTNSLMLQLIGEENPPGEAVYSANYLKNLIGHIVGLPHEIQFDLHTRFLPTALVEKTPREVLTVFFEHFTPQLVLEGIERATNRECDRPLFNAMNAFLPPGTDFSEVWSAAEEDEMQITKKGAYMLLKQDQYFTRKRKR